MFVIIAFFEWIPPFFFSDSIKAHIPLPPKPWPVHRGALKGYNGLFGFDEFKKSREPIDKGSETGIK
jgi:hypothetical protein